MEPLTNKSIGSISFILRNETKVLQNLFMLADFLDVSADTKLTSCRVGTKSGYECIKTILSDWLACQGSSATIQVLQEQLKQLGFVNAAGKLHQESLKQCLSFTFYTIPEMINSIGSSYESFKTEVSKSYHRINILNPVPNFMGREKELFKLREWYDVGSATSHVAVISGMGGQGKTELIRRFLQDCPRKRHCAWINGDGREALRESMDSLLAEIIPNEARQKLTLKQICQLFYQSKNISKHEWLLVVDNVDSIFDEFVDFVRLATTHGTLVIVTGRPLDIFSGQREHIHLEPFSLKDAVHLVSTMLGCTTEEDGLEDLCHTLGCHALALNQAASYIKSQREIRDSEYSPQDYINEFTITKLDNTLVLHSNMYNNTFSSVVNLSIQAAKSQASCPTCMEKALGILSLCGPSTVKYEHFSELYGILAHPAEETDTSESCSMQESQIIELVSVRVPLIRQDGDKLSSHRLVQEAVLETIGCSWMAESLVKHFFKLLEQKAEWSLALFHLPQIWLRIQDPDAISRYAMFPVELSCADNSFLKEDFLRDCLAKCRQILPHDHQAIQNLNVLLLFAKIEPGTMIHEFSHIVRKIHSAIEEGQTLDTSVVAFLLDYPNETECLLGEIETIIRYMIKNGQNSFSSLKITLLLMENLIHQGKFSEAAVLGKKLEASNTTPMSTDDFEQLLYSIEMFSEEQKLNDFTPKEYKECMTSLCSFTLKNAHCWCTQLPAFASNEFAEILCDLWSSETLVEKINLLLNSVSLDIQNKQKHEAKLLIKSNGRMSHAVSAALTKRKLYSKANTLLNKLLKSKLELLGPEHLSCFSTKSKIAMALISQGVFEEGFFLLRESVQYFLSIDSAKGWKHLKNIAFFMFVYVAKPENASYNREEFSSGISSHTKALFLRECSELVSKLMSTYSKVKKELWTEINDVRSLAFELEADINYEDKEVSRRLLELISKNSFTAMLFAHNDLEEWSEYLK